MMSFNLLNSDSHQSSEKISESALVKPSRKRLSASSNIQYPVVENVDRSMPLNENVIEPPEGGIYSDVSSDNIEIFDVIPQSELVILIKLYA